MSFTVAERTREIGLRTALGAQRASIVLTIAKRALTQLGVGVLIGMTIAGLLLYATNDEAGSVPYASFAFVLMAGVGVTVVIGMLACVVPTRRALSITPTEALSGGG